VQSAQRFAARGISLWHYGHSRVVGSAGTGAFFTRCTLCLFRVLLHAVKLK
jgi:hypothetical protein